MTILVTRPSPDNEATAAALRGAGYEALLWPSLRFEPMPVFDDSGANYEAVIVTSGNALRAIEGQPFLERLRGLTLLAVGDASAQVARQFGFKNVLSAKGDGDALREFVAKKLRKGATICYLAGADLGRDLTAELGERGYTVITHTTYRMIPAARFSDDVQSAFLAGEIEAALHYSRRSAKAFVEAAQTGGMEIIALSVPHCCISEAVAAILREAGAPYVFAAQTPDEKAIFAALKRAAPVA